MTPLVLAVFAIVPLYVWRRVGNELIADRLVRGIQWRDYDNFGGLRLSGPLRRKEKGVAWYTLEDIDHSWEYAGLVGLAPRSASPRHFRRALRVALNRGYLFVINTPFGPRYGISA